MTSKKDYKLDIFELIKHADAKDYNWFSELTEEQKNEFNPWLAMRFMSASTDGIDALEALLYTDTVLNDNFNIVSKYPDFFYLLMCVAGTGRYKKHFMISPPKKRKSSPIISELFNEIHPEPMEDDEIRQYIKLNDLDKHDISDFAYDIGWDEKKIKEVKNSFVKFME